MKRPRDPFFTALLVMILISLAIGLTILLTGCGDAFTVCHGSDATDSTTTTVCN